MQANQLQFFSASGSSIQSGCEKSCSETN